MLSKKKASRKARFFFCSLGYEHTVIVTGTGDSHWDRYLGMTAAMTQIPLTFAPDYR